ncbi:MAG: NAD(P)-dependent oxidoreductase [Marinosulfonomonas sp.]|nr:MAG: NAD(P)-dependent oxidoreductase [Marinosulfonomonas sp.]
MKNTLLSFGHGYSAQALGRHLIPRGWQVIGTSRDPENLPAISARGATAIHWPGDDISGALASATHLLISVAPNAEGDPVLNALRGQITAIAPQLKWVGYLSTIGVYGNHDGAWVNEDTPLTPATKRGKLRAFAEAEWQALAAEIGLPLHIFRLAGIYGPNRGPFAKVRKGTARRIIKPNQLFSRIHVEDIATVLAASIARPTPGRIYNVCDDNPAPPQDVIAYAAELLGLPIPPTEDFTTAEMTDMARSFYAESKSVSNARIKSELGVALKYPTYQVGLQSLLES